MRLEKRNINKKREKYIFMNDDSINFNYLSKWRKI